MPLCVCMSLCLCGRVSVSLSLSVHVCATVYVCGERSTRNGVCECALVCCGRGQRGCACGCRWGGGRAHSRGDTAAPPAHRERERRRGCRRAQGGREAGPDLAHAYAVPPRQAQACERAAGAGAEWGDLSLLPRVPPVAAPARAPLQALQPLRQPLRPSLLLDRSVVTHRHIGRTQARTVRECVRETPGCWCVYVCVCLRMCVCVYICLSLSLCAYVCCAYGHCLSVAVCVCVCV
jgi:hypothetical protein